MARYVFDSLFEKSLIDVCQNSDSMAKAAMRLGMNYKTLCFHAKRLGCFKANQSGLGFSKTPSKTPVPLKEIFNGSHLTYQSHKLKKRLLKEGIKQHQCESCGLSEWLSNPIPLEMHHVNGVSTDNALENIQLLCPNCHALTENYRAKNIKNLSARLETVGVEPFKFGETLSATIGNPEPSLTVKAVMEGVETLQTAPKSYF